MTLQLAATAHESASDAPLLLLGPSLGSDCAVLWESTIPFLADRFRIVTWDLPGHGRSAPASAPFDLADLADGVAALLPQLGAERAYHAGVSIAGATGLELGLRHGDRFDGVAVVCSAAKIGVPEAWRERAAKVRAEGTASLVEMSAARWFVPETFAAQPEYAKRVLATLAETDDESYALACGALERFDVRDRLGRIAVPTAALWADADPTLTEAQVREIADGVQHGSFARIHHASHLPVVDDPRQVADLILDAFA